MNGYLGQIVLASIQTWEKGPYAFLDFDIHVQGICAESCDTLGAEHGVVFNVPSIRDSGVACENSIGWYTLIKDVYAVTHIHPFRAGK